MSGESLFGLARRSFLLDGAGVFLAEYLIYFLVAGIAVFIFTEKSSRRRWFVFAALTLSAILSRGILTEAIRFFYPRPRPFEVLGLTPLFTENLNNSFPSGHATFIFALAMALWFFNRRWGTWYLVLAFAVGIARVFAGVHWPADILGGAAIGAVSAFLVHVLLRPYSPFKKPPAESETSGSA
jgi:undecaprenyl-diphosphatase